MLSARQLLLMRRARDRTIGVAIAPIGTVGLLPDPDFRRRVLRCVSHIGLLSLDMNRIRGRSARAEVNSKLKPLFSRFATYISFPAAPPDAAPAPLRRCRVRGRARWAD